MTSVAPATMGDLDRLVDLWVDLAASQREHGSLVVPGANDDAIRESLAQHVLADGVLLARADDQIVGFVMFGPDEVSYVRERDRGVVRNIYVVPEARGEGVGTALMDAAETQLVETGVQEISLEVMAENEDARRFYRRRGYDPHRIQLAKAVESDTHTK